MKHLAAALSATFGTPFKAAPAPGARGEETARAYHVGITPDDMGVYSVMINLHGVNHPQAHEPELYAYWDGVDTWSTWEFSVSAAKRARPKPGAAYAWRNLRP